MTKKTIDKKVLVSETVGEEYAADLQEAFDRITYEDFIPGSRVLFSECYTKGFDDGFDDGFRRGLKQGKRLGKKK